MSEHFSHFLLSGIPFLFLLFYLFRKIAFHPLKLLVFLALFSFIAFHAFPIHSAHAVFFADQTSHQCCLPTAVTPVVTYEVVLPDKIINEDFQIAETKISISTAFSIPGRSPPLG